MSEKTNFWSSSMILLAVYLDLTFNHMWPMQSHWTVLPWLGLPSLSSEWCWADFAASPRLSSERWVEDGKAAQWAGCQPEMLWECTAVRGDVAQLGLRQTSLWRYCRVGAFWPHPFADASVMFGLGLTWLCVGSGSIGRSQSTVSPLRSKRCLLMHSVCGGSCFLLFGQPKH